MNSNDSAKVSVRCDALTKDYTKQQCEKLAGIGYGELYNTLAKGELLLSEEDRQVKALANKLKEKVNSFTPNVPVGASERKRLEAHNEKWIKQIDALLLSITPRSKPIYLADEVNRLLTERGSQITCERKHLVWYLHRYGAEQMQPDKIAETLIDIEPKDFEKLRLPSSKAAYSLVPSESGVHDRSTILPVIEFIYAIPSSIDDSTLAGKIKNDLKLMDEFKKLKNGANSKYDPQPYYDLRNKMQTIPSVQDQQEPESPEECPSIEEPDGLTDNVISSISETACSETSEQATKDDVIIFIASYTRQNSDRSWIADNYGDAAEAFSNLQDSKGLLESIKVEFAQMSEIQFAEKYTRDGRTMAKSTAAALRIREVATKGSL